MESGEERSPTLVKTRRWRVSLTTVASREHTSATSLQIRIDDPSLQGYIFPMIPRPLYREAVSRALLRSPVTALLGPRQCGKTTLARLIGQERESHYFDMESPVDRQRLQNPELALGTLSGLVIIDEIGRASCRERV